MVDLVKIRKKAKKEKRSADVSSAPPPPPPAPEPPPEPRADETSALLGSSKLESFRETAGTKREGLIVVAEQREQVEGEQLELLTFDIAGEQYAVGIERIIEIVRPRPVTRVPNADPSVVGIISLRGTIVTVVDVRRRLRHRARSDRGDPRIVVVEFGGETLGFEVDRVHRVVRVPAAGIEPHPVVHASELSEAIRGVFRAGGALTILLDLDKLLDSRVTRIHGTDM